MIKKFSVDRAVFAYSGVAHEHLMHKAPAVLAAGTDFVLMGPKSTTLKASKPIASVCAVRTGVGEEPDDAKGL